MPYFTYAGRTIRNLFSKPSTRLYPIQKRQHFKITRGHILLNGETCIFCGICAKKCPTDAIKTARKEKSWEIERLKCIACGCCVDACPKNSLSMINTYQPCSAQKEIEITRELFIGKDTESPTDKDETALNK